MTKLARLGLIAGTFALAAGAASAQDATPKPHIPLQKTIGAVTPTGPVPSLFVLNSDGATLKDGKLTMTGVSPNSIVFADRPVRAAGHVMTAQFVQQWDEDKGNFVVEPPNGTISVLGGVGADVSDAVVTLMKPVLEGTTLTFDVKVLEGSLAGSGPAALFIDRGGFGGGGFGGGRGFEGHVGGFDGGVDRFHGTYAHVGDTTVAHVGGTYWHAPEYHGAWYRGADYPGWLPGAGLAAGAIAGAAIGSRYYDDHPYCGYYPYPPCPYPN
jgi:hypothetical protein